MSPTLVQPPCDCPANHLPGWGIPFFWAAIWAGFSVIWAKRDMQKERITWEMDYKVTPHEKKLQIETPSTPEPSSDNEAEPKSAAPQFTTPDHGRGRDVEPKPDLESKSDDTPKSEPRKEDEFESKPGVDSKGETEPDLEAQKQDTSTQS